ncbi:MAG TPA: hypothetical protein VGA61_16100 [Anaerolineae bacterium]
MQQDREAKVAAPGRSPGAGQSLAEVMMDCYNAWEWSTVGRAGRQPEADSAARGAPAGAGAEDLMRYYNGAWM